jgi:NDP-sugar pyrophosphorylase family protein
MKALLICPAAVPSLRVLCETGPMETVPLLGQGLVEYWLSHLASLGIKEVSILSHDRSEHLQRLLARGARWGLKVDVIEESRELPAAQALLKYEPQLGGSLPQDRVILMDHFPGQPTSLFGSFQQLHRGLLEWMPNAKTPDRVGVKESQPGIWTGLNCNLATDLELQPPCWIGNNVYIGSGTTLGPGSIIEDGSFIEGICSISESCVGPHTFVGQCSELSRSLAYGDTLVNLDTGFGVKVPDRFVLCALKQQASTQGLSWFARLAEIYCRNKAEAQLFWKHLLINRGS